MADYPEKLIEYLDYFSALEDRNERIDLLSGLAERYTPVPESVAQRPYPDSHRVASCESRVYLWARKMPDDRLRFYFSVENPQGIAAMATVVIFEESLSGAPLKQILQIDPEVVLDFFGEELSARKRIGLMQIVKKIQSTVQTFEQTGEVE